MKISLTNAVRGLSEYITKEFSSVHNLSGLGAAVFAEYKLVTQGTKILQSLDDGTGYIALDDLERIINKYQFNGQTIKTIVGDITISADTPQQIINKLKEYGEN